MNISKNLLEPLIDRTNGKIVKGDSRVRHLYCVTFLCSHQGESGSTGINTKGKAMALETTTNLKPETINFLQELIQINVDSRDGCRQAAQDIDDMTISQMFLQMADEREQQATQLSQYVELNNEEANRAGSFAAALHRSWMSLRELLSTDNTYAVLEEAERGEDQIKAAYEHAIKETAGSAVNDVLLNQYAKVKLAHDRVRDLRDQYKTP